MAVYIKNLRGKDRERRPGDVWKTSREVRQTIESLPSFKAVQAQMNAGVSEVQNRLREERESDGKRHRWATRTSEEKGRECIDALTKTIKEHGEQGIVDAKTHEEARAKAVAVAEKHDRIKSGE